MYAVKERSQAELFVETLRRLCQSTPIEQGSAQLAEIYHSAPYATPEISAHLHDLRFEPDYPQMLDYLCVSGIANFPDLFPYISSVIEHTDSAFVQAFYRMRKALHSGDEPAFLRATIVALKTAKTQEEQWSIMRECVFCFKTMGHYWRSQQCALLGYQIAQALQEEAFLQRSRFSVLNTTRLVGGVDLRAQYSKQNTEFAKGDLSYDSSIQSLLPIYAAMHQMDLGINDGSLKNHLHAMEDACVELFAQLNVDIAWSRYFQLTGRRRVALERFKRAEHHLDSWRTDASVTQPLSMLATEFGLSLNFEPAKIETAPTKLWHSFDLALDEFTTSRLSTFQ